MNQSMICRLGGDKETLSLLVTESAGTHLTWVPAEWWLQPLSPANNLFNLDETIKGACSTGSKQVKQKHLRVAATSNAFGRMDAGPATHTYAQISANACDL